MGHSPFVNGKLPFVLILKASKDLKISIPVNFLSHDESKDEQCVSTPYKSNFTQLVLLFLPNCDYWG